MPYHFFLKHPILLQTSTAKAYLSGFRNPGQFSCTTTYAIE
jgi:hypothetical protein